MADDPIVPQNFLGGVNVVDIGDIRVARGMTRRPASACTHRRMVYDQKERRIWCQDCEREVESFDAFLILTEYHAAAVKDLQKRAAALKEAEEHKLRTIAAKEMDKAWQSRTMVPSCPSCGHGLFPEDFRAGPGMTGKEYAEAMRAKRQKERGNA